MGRRPPCCDKLHVKKGPWTAEEDAKILAYVASHGIGNWTLVPQKAGLNRCRKSCRLRWRNYLRPDLKHDSFTPIEEDLIIKDVESSSMVDNVLKFQPPEVAATPPQGKHGIARVDKDNGASSVTSRNKKKYESRKDKVTN